MYISFILEHFTFIIFWNFKDVSNLEIMFVLYNLNFIYLEFKLYLLN